MTKYEQLQDKEIKTNLVHKTEVLQRRSQQMPYANFGMIAALGGAVIVPLIIAVWLGRYLDQAYPQNFSWLLNCLFFGFVWSVINAYFWLKIENEKIVHLSGAEQKSEEMEDE